MIKNCKVLPKPPGLLGGIFVSLAISQTPAYSARPWKFIVHMLYKDTYCYSFFSRVVYFVFF